MGARIVIFGCPVNKSHIYNCRWRRRDKCDHNQLGRSMVMDAKSTIKIVAKVSNLALGWC